MRMFVPFLLTLKFAESGFAVRLEDLSCKSSLRGAAFVRKMHVPLLPNPPANLCVILSALSSIQFPGRKNNTTQWLLRVAACDSECKYWVWTGLQAGASYTFFMLAFLTWA